jgi:hypothetical protein
MGGAMSEPHYDPDERFQLDQEPENVLRKLMGVEPSEDPVEDEKSEEPES